MITKPSLEFDFLISNNGKRFTASNQAVRNESAYYAYIRITSTYLPRRPRGLTDGRVPSSQPRNATGRQSTRSLRCRKLCSCVAHSTTHGPEPLEQNLGSPRCELRTMFGPRTYPNAPACRASMRRIGGMKIFRTEEGLC